MGMMEGGDHVVWGILSVVGVLVTYQQVHLGDVGAHSCVSWASVHNNLRQFSHWCNHPARMHEGNPVTNGPTHQSSGSDEVMNKALGLCSNSKMPTQN